MKRQYTIRQRIALFGTSGWSVKFVRWLLMDKHWTGW